MTPSFHPIRRSSNMVVVNQCRALFLASCLSAAASAQNATLPIVDLGYELHQAAHFDVCIPSQLR